MSKVVYVKNGVDVDPTWFGSIAVSPDNVNWELISKEGLSVKPVFISGGTSNPANVIGPAIRTKIVLSDFTNSTLYEFECNDVTNQPTWQGKTKAALRNAVRDLGEWIGELYASSSSGNEAEFMEVLIQDANGDLYFMVRTLDENTGVYTITYINADGTAAVPVAPVTPVAASPSVQETPAISTVAAAGSVTAGKRSVTIFNQGGAAGTVMGASVAAGLAVTFSAHGNNTLAAIAYDATGTSFLITTTE